MITKNLSPSPNKDLGLPKVQLTSYGFLKKDLINSKQLKMSLEIAQKSYKNPHKPKNGDYSSFQLLEQEQLVLAVLADGVGSCPCDWNASQLSCQTFIKTFEQNNKKEIIPRFSEAIRQANQVVLTTTGSCQGMKSTFCGLVWDLKAQVVYYTNIGDSRIYETGEKGWVQISTDEVRTKINRDAILYHTAVREGITNAIGHSTLTFEIKKKADKGIRAFVLTTDGFHGVAASFPEEALKAINAIHLEQGLEQLYQQYETRQKDDMTILVLRKVEDKNCQAIITSILTTGTVSITTTTALERAFALLQGLKEGIREKNEKQVHQFLSFCKTHQIDLGRDKIGDLISLMIKVDFQNNEIYQTLIKRMKNSRL